MQNPKTLVNIYNGALLHMFFLTFKHVQMIHFRIYVYVVVRLKSIQCEKNIVIWLWF